MSPLITIAIPTRNRQVCAATLVRAVLELLPDCQVVVNDNSDDDSLQTLLADRLCDPRLSYQYDASTLSVVDNFNSTLARATGDYVAFLGDDDMIGPRFFELVLKAKAEGIDALLYRTKGRPLHYFWPGVSSPRWGDMSGKLYFSDYTGSAGSLDARKAMLEAIAHLGTGPRQMPRIYLGVVAKSLIDRIQGAYGSLFGGFSPDVYSSHLLSSCCVKPVVVDFPLIIPGASPKSTSAARAKRSDMGELTDNDHIGRFANVDWDERIPRYYSPYTVWAQSHVMAHKKTATRVPLRAFVHLYATCLIFTPTQARGTLLRAIRAHGKVSAQMAVLLWMLPALPTVLMTYLLGRFSAFLKHRPGGARFEISDLPDARIAMGKLESTMADGLPLFCK